MINLIEQWFHELTVQHYKATTIRTYHQSLQPFLAFLQHANIHDFDKITRQHISDYLAKRIDKDKMAKVSVQHELTVLRQLFHWLIKNEFIHQNPVLAHKIKRSARNLPTLVDIDTLNQLLEQAEPDNEKQRQLWLRDKAMFELLYGSGLRVSELVGLNLSDINSHDKLIHVIGKGDKARIVPIGRKAWQALQNYLPIRQTWLKTSSSAVFISQKGERISTRTVELRIKHHAKRANIPQTMYPHLLRHCFASHILSGSGDLRGVQELLGHEDISTTQIYTHLDFAHLSKVYDNAHPRSRRS